MSNVTLRVNGSTHTVDIEPSTPLLYILRNDLGLQGPRFGCGLGQCGACTVIVDKLAVNSCLFLAVDADGTNLETIEGLASKEGNLHPVQQSFVDNGGIQCGFCSPGMIMSAKAFLDSNSEASRDEIKHALAGNICRCTGYVQILDSVEAAQKSILAGGGSAGGQK